MSSYRIAVVGGTGPQGKGLGYRWAAAGHDVTLGSRSAERAAATAEEIRARIGDATTQGADAVSMAGATNLEAARAADVVVLAVPYDGHEALVTELAAELDGKVVISCVNPLGFDKRGPFGLDVPGGSAAEEAQATATGARLVGAFHHVSAVSLWGDEDTLDHEDVLVCGDDEAAKQVAMELAVAVTGHLGIDAGALRLARQLEPLTAVLISVNKKYKVRSGLAMAGVPREEGRD